MGSLKTAFSERVVIFDVSLFSFFMIIFHSCGASGDPRKSIVLDPFFCPRMALKMVPKIDTQK